MGTYIDIIRAMTASVPSNPHDPPTIKTTSPFSSQSPLLPGTKRGTHPGGAWLGCFNGPEIEVFDLGNIYG